MAFGLFRQREERTWAEPFGARRARTRVTREDSQPCTRGPPQGQWWLSPEWQLDGPLRALCAEAECDLGRQEPGGLGRCRRLAECLRGVVPRLRGGSGPLTRTAQRGCWRRVPPGPSGGALSQGPSPRPCHALGPAWPLCSLSSVLSVWQTLVLAHCVPGPGFSAGSLWAWGVASVWGSWERCSCLPCGSHQERGLGLDPQVGPAPRGPAGLLSEDQVAQVRE